MNIWITKNPITHHLKSRPMANQGWSESAGNWLRTKFDDWQRTDRELRTECDCVEMGWRSELTVKQGCRYNHCWHHFHSCHYIITVSYTFCTCFCPPLLLYCGQHATPTPLSSLFSSAPTNTWLAAYIITKTFLGDGESCLFCKIRSSSGRCSKGFSPSQISTERRAEDDSASDNRTREKKNRTKTRFA